MLYRGERLVDCKRVTMRPRKENWGKTKPTLWTHQSAIDIHYQTITLRIDYLKPRICMRTRLFSSPKSAWSQPKEQAIITTIDSQTMFSFGIDPALENGRRHLYYEERWYLVMFCNVISHWKTLPITEVISPLFCHAVILGNEVILADVVLFGNVSLLWYIRYPSLL